MSVMLSKSRLPAIFFGHGSPTNAIENNKYTKAWVDIIKNIAKPKAIIAISAHWETIGTRVTSNKLQNIIYDFYGFSQELYNIKYTPRGEPELANKIVSLISSIKPDDSWGLDHGTWSVLRHIYPNADVPVVQISIDKNKTIKEHYKLAQKLRTLREDGYLIIGSGNLVHNLRMIKWSGNQDPYPWALDFNNKIKSVIVNNDFESVLDYLSIKGSRESVPTAEHFLPAVYVLALIGDGENASFFAQGFEMGSLSMDSFIIN